MSRAHPEITNRAESVTPYFIEAEQHQELNLRG